MSLYKIFKQLNIAYEEIEHEAVMTIEQAKQIKNKIDGIGCKNLFLTDKKGKYFLIVLEEDKKADLKFLAKIVKASRLSFAKISELESILHLKQGSVTPFGIINDIDNKVLLLIDSDLIGKKLLFHPNINTKTVSISFEDLIKFIQFENHDYINI